MANDLQSLVKDWSQVPEKWQPRFVLKQIEEEDIEISLRERDAIVHALESGGRFIMVQGSTIMLNSIKNITPLYGKANIPPRPKAKYTYKQINDNTMREVLTNKEELDEWDKYFGDIPLTLLALPDETV